MAVFLFAPKKTSEWFKFLQIDLIFCNKISTELESEHFYNSFIVKWISLCILFSKGYQLKAKENNRMTNFPRISQTTWLRSWFWQLFGFVEIHFRYLRISQIPNDWKWISRFEQLICVYRKTFVPPDALFTVKKSCPTIDCGYREH